MRLVVKARLSVVQVVTGQDDLTFNQNVAAFTVFKAVSYTHLLKQAKAEGLKNFFVFCNHVLTPPAMRHILKNQEKVQIEGFVGPAHVSTIIGSEPYETFAKDYSKPVVIAGFEPLDMLQSILMPVSYTHLADSPGTSEKLSCSSEGGHRAAGQ